MARALALVAPVRIALPVEEALRGALVIGCAIALICAGHPLPLL